MVQGDLGEGGVLRPGASGHLVTWFHTQLKQCNSPLLNTGMSLQSILGFLLAPCLKTGKARFKIQAGGQRYGGVPLPPFFSLGAVKNQRFFQAD